MSDRYAHVLSFALEHPWAVTPPMLAIIAGILGRRVAGLEATEAEIAAALVNRKNLPTPTGGAVAVIPIHGVIAPRVNLMSDIIGGTTFEGLTGQLRDAMANADVKTIVLDVDSPGGNAAGATEFAREVMKARAKKPIIAQAQYTMASAAYWVAAAATEIVASPSAQVGSIGVYLIHNDLSAALEQMGIKRTHIAAGKHKLLGNSSAPLSTEDTALLQATVDTAYSQFVGDVSKGRGVPVKDVRNGYGDGRVVQAAEALSLGMIDRIATLDETIARALAAPPTNSGTSAHDTAQELARATAQDRAADLTWQHGIDAALLELDL